MKNKLIYVITIALTLCCCETELEIDLASFPPKLCVTAILDGEIGNFSITLSEGRALADFKTPQPYSRTIIRNGKISLYENDNLILIEEGVFDMSYTDYNDNMGYKFFAEGITTNPGSTYKLEVEVEGYNKVFSTSVMPLPPVVSATIDTTKVEKKEVVNLYYWGYWDIDWGDDHFWPVKLYWDELETGRNYYALEMFKERTVISGDPGEWGTEDVLKSGIYSDDITKLQDNPEIERAGGDLDIINSLSDIGGLYLFDILLMSDISLTPENNSLSLYKSREKQTEDYWYPEDSYEKIEINNKITLRVRHITNETFKYYRSLRMQDSGVGFFTEPVNIVSNIENGYGCFTVFSATNIELVEYNTFMYRYIDEYE